MPLTYETAHDRLIEDEVAGHVAWVWRVEDAGRLGDKNPSDRLFIKDGKPYAVAEIKARKFEKGRYPTAFLTASKLGHLFDRMQERGCLGYFLPVWYDQIGAISAERIRDGGYERRQVIARQPQGPPERADVIVIRAEDIHTVAWWWAESLLGKEQRDG